MPAASSANHERRRPTAHPPTRPSPGDERAPSSAPAATPAPTLAPAKAVPGSLRQLWTAPSPKTTTPLVVSGSVVTGDGRDVEGRDPATGNTRWSYARDLELCGVTHVYNYAVAVYTDV